MSNRKLQSKMAGIEVSMPVALAPTGLTEECNMLMVKY